MSTNSTPRLANEVLHVVTQRVGNGWRCLFVSVIDEQPPSLVSTIEVDSDHELESLLGEKIPDKIFTILPGSVTVCRTTTLPDVDSQQIHEALRLQAEARLLGSTPDHRRALAPLDPAAGETNRVGLIVTWPESSVFTLPACLQHARFIPDTVSIAALLDGFRPTDPILFADLSDGTVSIALSHANGAALRATKEDNSNQNIFRDRILQITKETASLHNHSAAYTQGLVDQLESELLQIEIESPITILPHDIITGAANRLDGSDAGDLSWWRTWGIAVGGILAATGSLQSLTTIRAEAPVVHPSRREWLTNKLSSRSLSAKLVTAAILILVFGPTLVSGSRLAILELLHPDLESQYAQVVTSRQQQVVYNELSNSAWPMTKVIADVINNLPVGIEVDTLKLDAGDPISLRGRAIDKDGKSAAELIAALQANLQSSGMFKDIQFAYDPAGTYGDREFDLWATVMKPLKRPRYSIEQDFGRWTLAMRQDGTQPEEAEDWGNVDSLSDETRDPSDQNEINEEETTQRERERHRQVGDSGSNAASRNEERGGGGAPTRIPEPLSAQQIAVMSEAEVRVALTDVSTALDRVGNRDEEARTRLKKEFHLLLDRLKESQR